MKHFGLVGASPVVGIAAHLKFSKLWTPSEYGEEIIVRDPNGPTPAWLEMPWLRPVIFDLMNTLQATRLGTVVCQRIKPGAELRFRTDPPMVWRQIIVKNFDGSLIRIGDEVIHPQGGEVWHWEAGEVSMENGSPDDAESIILEVVTT